MEKDIPLEWINLYSMYQHNVYKFFNELDKIFTQYLEFMIDLQQDWLSFWKIILNSDLPYSPNFAVKPTIVTPNSTPTKESLVQQRKVEKIKDKKENKILNQSLSKLPLF